MPNLYRRRGAEILVNTETSGSQLAQSIAALPSGGFVVVWSDTSGVGGDTPDSGIKGQRFDADGNKVGVEFLANTEIDGFQGQSEVAALDDGRFVVTWTSQIGAEGDDPGSGIKGQVFNADGTKSGGEFVVNTSAPDLQIQPTITALANGGFVVSWTDLSELGGDPDGGIKMQIFDSSGVPVGGELLANTATAGSQVSPAMTALASGGFAVVWSGGGMVTFQLFDAAGAKVGSELQVNSVSGVASSPDIAPLGSGFIVTWSHRDFALDPFKVFAQLLDANGAKIGGEFQVSTTAAGDQTLARIAPLPDGSFLVTWQSASSGSAGMDVRGQVLTAAGVKAGVEFVVNGLTAGAQTVPEIVVLASGDIVATWTDASGLGGDASPAGVKMQFLTTSTAAPTDIALSYTEITEVSIENLAVAALSATNSGGLNSQFAYQIVSDSSGGAFRIEGDQLIVDDNGKLDFETEPNISLRIRVTDINGTSYEETFSIAVADAPTEIRYAAGDEFRVNSDTLGFNTAVAMAALASGGFAVVTHWFEIGIGDGYRLQIFDAAGAPVGAERDLDLLERGGSGIVVAGLPSGGFVIAYEGSSIDLGGGSNGFPVRAQLFDPAGNEVGADLVVSQTNGGILTQPRVTTLSSGGFVVTWSVPIHEDGGNGGPFPSQIMARIYDAGGAALGNEFRANTGIENSQVNSHVAALPGGGFVVAWEEFEAGTFRIEGQIFDAAGAKVGDELVLHSLSQTGSYDLSDYRLTALATGSVLISWVQRFAENPDVYEILGRVLAPDGTMGATMYLVAATLGATHEIAALPGGGFVLTADSLDHVDPALDDYQTFGLIFDAAGARVGYGFLVPESGADDEVGPFVAALGSGDIAFTWTRQFLEGNSVTSDTYARLLTLADQAINGTSGPDILNGTSGDDEINGLGGNDVINGLGGNDVMRGGTGDDTYFVGEVADVIVEAAGEGFDQVYTSVSYVLAAGVSAEILAAANAGATTALNLTGNALAQQIFGNAGANVLTGGGGADALYGYGGNDVYFVEGDDYIADAANGGFDQAYSSTGITLTAGAAIEVLAVNDYNATNAVTIIGNEFAQQIFGNAGANILVSGGGQDALYGNGGDDIYLIDGDDHLVEAAGGGFDQAYSSTGITLTAGAAIEVLAVNDYNATNAMTIIGNEFAQQIFGNAGANILVSGGGADALYGNGGDDIYLIDGDDHLVEAANGGFDQAYSSTNITLTAGAAIEVLGASDSNATVALNLTGNALGQQIFGNAGANMIDGGGGNDELYGLGGADSFVFTAAPGGANLTTLADFSAADDTILLNRTAFAAISAGALNPDAFVIGTAAQDANDRIIYDQATGNLFYDADGNGGGAQIQFATLDAAPAITAGDFLVI